MLWFIQHTTILFPALLIGLFVIVEIGLRLRHASGSFDPARQSQIEAARDGLGVLLSLLLGFTLPMAVPHFEQRRQLTVDEANAIKTVFRRAEMLPDPYRSQIISLVRQYVDVRVQFGRTWTERDPKASLERAQQLQSEMWQQTATMVQQQPNSITPIFVQALGGLADLREQRLAAEEKRIPLQIWLVLFLISALTCFVVGYSMEHRFLLAMLVLPLTVAIVLSLVAELESPRTGFIRTRQPSMERVQMDLESEVAPAR
jgi:hypothetical protein